MGIILRQCKMGHWNPKTNSRINGINLSKGKQINNKNLFISKTNTICWMVQKISNLLNEDEC